MKHLIWVVKNPDIYLIYTPTPPHPTSHPAKELRHIHMYYKEHLARCRAITVTSRDRHDIPKDRQLDGPVNC